MYNIKIMVVENHRITSQLLVLILKGLGYVNILSAESGEQALSELRAYGRVDVLIYDIQMSGVDGLNFISHPYCITNINALILTSEMAADLRLSVEQMARMLGYQVLGKAVKPFSRSRLKALLLRYLPPAPKNPQMINSEMPSLAEIRQGLIEGAFVPYLQPKINLKTRKVIGVEVLARWQHPRHGLLQPAQFLEHMQLYGLLDELTQSITRQALLFFKDNYLASKLSLAINLDVSQMALPCMLGWLENTLADHQFQTNRLIIEVTETGLTETTVTILENLVRFRMVGCNVSIDDFGAGFSSILRICEMPCTEFKLDASLILSMTYNSRSLAAVDSMLRLASSLGLTVVAEGIETVEQLSSLEQMGCPVGQGYLFSKPLSLANFNPWLNLYNKALQT